MVKDLVIYPDTRIKTMSADVRSFDEGLYALMENMLDTMNKNALDEISAIQIAIPWAVTLIRLDDTISELINPRVISMNNPVEFEENSTYYPGASAIVPRFNDINVIYQDRHAKQHALKATGLLALRIQKQMDYNYGSTFVDRLHAKDRVTFEKQIASGTKGLIQSCPTTFKRDALTGSFKLMFYFMFFTLIGSLFVSDTALLKGIGSLYSYSVLLTSILIIGYFFYAQYEARQSSSCTSCQTGNIIGTSFIALIKLLALAVAGYFLINP